MAATARMSSARMVRTLPLKSPRACWIIFRYRASISKLGPSSSASRLRSTATFSPDAAAVGRRCAVGVAGIGKQLVDRRLVDEGQSGQPGHGDRPLTAFVGPEHRRLELAARELLHGVQRQLLLGPDRPQALAHQTGVRGAGAVFAGGVLGFHFLDHGRIGTTRKTTQSEKRRLPWPLRRHRAEMATIGASPTAEGGRRPPRALSRAWERRNGRHQQDPGGDGGGLGPQDVGSQPDLSDGPSPLASSSAVHPPSGPMSTVGLLDPVSSAGDGQGNVVTTGGDQLAKALHLGDLRQPHPAALHTGAAHDAPEPLHRLVALIAGPAHHAPGAVKRHDAVDPDLRQGPHHQVGAVSLDHGEADRQRRSGGRLRHHGPELAAAPLRARPDASGPRPSPTVISAPARRRSTRSRWCRSAPSRTGSSTEETKTWAAAVRGVSTAGPAAHPAVRRRRT